MASIKKIEATSSETLWTKLIEYLDSADVYTQLNVLTFLNSMLQSAPDNERDSLVQLWETKGLSKILKVKRT
jgi:hypothetical protein